MYYVSVSEKNHHRRRANNAMKILDAPLQISSLEEQQRITERPPPAWFMTEKKVTTVITSCICLLYISSCKHVLIGVVWFSLMCFSNFNSGNK